MVRSLLLSSLSIAYEQYKVRLAADLMKFLLAAPDDSKTEMFFHRVEVPIAVKQRVTVH